MAEWQCDECHTIWNTTTDRRPEPECDTCPNEECPSKGIYTKIKISELEELRRAAGRERGEEGAGRPVRSGDEVQYNGSPWEVEEIQAVGGRARLHLVNDDGDCTAWADELDGSALCQREGGAGAFRLLPGCSRGHLNSDLANFCITCGEKLGLAVSASSSPQRAFGQIRVELAGKIIGILDRYYNDDEYKPYMACSDLLALLGEAPPTKEAEQSPGDKRWTWAGILQFAMYRAALRGWKRGRENKDPEADEITDALLREPEITALNTFLAGAEPSPNSPPGATVQPQARPMKLKAEVGDDFHNGPWLDVESEYGIVLEARNKGLDVFEEIAYRINSFEPQAEGGAE